MWLVTGGWRAAGVTRLVIQARGWSQVPGWRVEAGGASWGNAQQEGNLQQRNKHRQELDRHRGHLSLEPKESYSRWV